MVFVKEHYYDALSVGEIPTKFHFLTDKVLLISAKASKSVNGFQTGDMARAIVPKGLKKGEYLGRVIIHSNECFDVKTNKETIQGIWYKHFHIIQRGDGYLYNYKECDSFSGKNNQVSITRI